MIRQRCGVVLRGYVGGVREQGSRHLVLMSVSQERDSRILRLRICEANSLTFTAQTQNFAFPHTSSSDISHSKMSSNIGIPIKLLNEAQVRVLSTTHPLPVKPTSMPKHRRTFEFSTDMRSI